MKTACSDKVDLHFIKKYLSVDEIIYIKTGPFFIKKFIKIFINKIKENKNVVLLLSVPSNGSPVEVTTSLYTLKFQEWYVMRTIKKEGLEATSYGIYPSIEKPTFIFELDTCSQYYAEKYLVPDAGAGFKGLFKKATKSLIGINPSIAGIIIRVDQ